MMEVKFVHPFEVNAEKAQELKGKVVVLDVAFRTDTQYSSFATTTLPFIQALGDRLALWVDHHEHERHADFVNDPRFILVSRQHHPAIPEIITPELVEKIGPVDTIVAHGDFDGIMAAAKWILGGQEPYPGADEDARAADSRIGSMSDIGQLIDQALKADPTDDEFRQIILRYLVSYCQDRESREKIEARAKTYFEIKERTERWAKHYVIDDGLAILDIRSEQKRVDMTELLLKGENLAPSKIAVVRNRNTKTGEMQVTIAAPVDSGHDFVKLFRLGGSMATRVTLPDERYWEAIAKIKGKVSPPEIKPPCFILYADVDRIKDYLFASVRMRHIIAASGLLSHVNEEETNWLILAHDGRIIFSAGGITQAIFADRKKAEKVGIELKKLYIERTGTASITVIVVEWRNGQNFADAIDEARRKMGKKKMGMDEGERDDEQENYSQVFKGRAIFFSGSPFFQICELTGKEFAVGQDLEGRGYGITIRQAERWRERQGMQKRKLIGDKEFDPRLGDRLEVDTILRCQIAEELKCDANWLAFPEDFEELAIDAQPRGYIGFIEADGNRFGEMLKELKVGVRQKFPEEQISAYEEFSQLLKETTKEALVKAAVVVLKDALRNAPQRDGRKLIPMRVLFLGGDDVMLVVQAQYAIKLADEFCRLFQKIAEQKKRENKILKDIQLSTFTMSAGVVIAHHNVPFLSLHRMSSELLKSAKRRSWKAWGQKKAGAVDFQVVTGSNIEDLKTVREELYTLYDGREKILLTGRPYLVSPDQDELSELLGIVERLKEAVIPRNQLKQLSMIMRLGKEQSRVAFHRWFLRLGGEGENKKKEEIRKALGTNQEIPDIWKKDERAGGSGKLYCPLLDIVELLDLIYS